MNEEAYVALQDEVAELRSLLSHPEVKEKIEETKKKRKVGKQVEDEGD